MCHQKTGNKLKKYNEYCLSDSGCEKFPIINIPRFCKIINYTKELWISVE